MPSGEEFKIQLEDAQSALSAALARIHTLKQREKRLTHEKAHLLIASGQADQGSAAASQVGPAENGKAESEAAEEAHDVLLLHGHRKVPGSLIIGKSQLEFHAIEARVKHSDFVGISTATKPPPPEPHSPQPQHSGDKAAWMCCLTAPAVEHGDHNDATARDAGHFDSLDGIDGNPLVELQQPAGAWKLIWKQGETPRHLTFEASQHTREALHQCTERWLGCQASGTAPEDEAAASAKLEVVAPTHLPVGTYQPSLTDPSGILSEPAIRSLAAVLPARHQHSSWGLLYATHRHGISLSTLFRRCNGAAPCILVVKDEAGYVFGAYTADTWRPAPRFYGSGESFVFTLEPHRTVYPWKRGTRTRNDYFQLASPDALAVGGAGGPAIWVDGELERGTSAPCGTFGSPSLAFREEFRVASLELWHVM